MQSRFSAHSNKSCNPDKAFLLGWALFFPSELTSFWKFIFARTDVLPLFHWCTFVLAVTFVLAQKARTWTLHGLEKRDTFRKDEWQKDGCAVMKLLLPAYLSVPSCEWAETSSVLLVSTVLLDIPVLSKAGKTTFYKTCLLTYRIFFS